MQLLSSAERIDTWTHPGSMDLPPSRCLGFDQCSSGGLWQAEIEAAAGEGTGAPKKNSNKRQKRLRFQVFCSCRSLNFVSFLGVLLNCSHLGAQSCLSSSGYGSRYRYRATSELVCGAVVGLGAHYLRMLMPWIHLCAPPRPPLAFSARVRFSPCIYVCRRRPMFPCHQPS